MKLKTILNTKMQNPKYEGEKIAYLDNDFIRKSTALQPLTELEINLLMYMCYKAKENVDKVTGEGWTKRIEIDMKKFFDGIGYSKSWTEYTDEEKMAVYLRLKAMQEKTFEIHTDVHKELDRKGKLTGIYESYSYFSYIKYHFDTGILDVSMPRETKSFLLNYDNGFTPIEFKNMIKLKSKYAKILYLFFRSFRDGIKCTDYTIEHLRQLLGLSNKYPKWADLKRYVLIPALKEINEKSDILVVGRYDAYTSAMDGRKREDMTPDEYAKIVIDSMAQKGSRGKGVYKISFRVLENHNTSDETQKLDMKSLLGIEKYNTPNKKI